MFNDFRIWSNQIRIVRLFDTLVTFFSLFAYTTVIRVDHFMTMLYTITSDFFHCREKTLCRKFSIKIKSFLLPLNTTTQN